MSVKPSMKTKVRNEARKSEMDEFDEHYAVHFTFEFIKKKLLCYPHSACGCCDGRRVCSHMKGFLLFIRCGQKCYFNRDFFEKAIPENHIALNNALMLIEKKAQLMQ